LLVYGKASRTSDPRDRLAALATLLREVAEEPPGIRRHAARVAALIEAGELAQGIADAAFLDHGRDLACPARDAATALLLDLARSVWDSWRTGFRTSPGTPDLTALAATRLPARITTRWAEGFAFYALYPESYAMAATRAALAATTRVVGIRSIGAPLSAMVAAGLGSFDMQTVRPVGHPFRRALALDDTFAAALTAGDPAGFAIVDEGPGLSGSSFGAVMDTLAHLGIAEGRLSLFPSHSGAPGPQATERHRARWQRATRHTVPFEDVMLAGGGLASWVADLVGPAQAPLIEISGGGWRAFQGRSADAWPPVNAQQEKRKFLLRAGGTLWHLKFAGLGPASRAKLDRARALHAAGFTPPVAGYRHGFLVERWIADGRPLDLGAVAPGVLIDWVGRYLGFRARHFASGPERGASLSELLAMARHNVGEALGPDWAERLDAWSEPRLAELAGRACPVEIDGRMQPWEFLVRPDGSLLKCDALDHHAAHNLVGCQDIAWDVIGAVVELSLPEDSRDRLATFVAQEGGNPVDPDLLAFLTPCYLAFQLGAASMAADAAHDDIEGWRQRRSRARYTEHLRLVLRP
jgi:hypothetical protein